MNKSYLKILSTILIITSSLYSFGQSPRAGVKAGLSFSNLYLDEVDDENMRIGGHAGIYSQFMDEGSAIGLQAELLLSTKGAGATYDFFGANGKVNFNMLYLDVPVLMVIKVGEVVDLHGGVYGGFLLAASTSSSGDLGESYQELDRDNFDQFDYGLAIGTTVNLELISIGARYNYGLNEIAQSTTADLFLGNSKNSVFQLFVGLNLN